MHTYTHVRCVKHFCCILLATTIITMLKISMNEKEKEEWKNKNYEKTRKSCLLVCRFVFLFSFHFLLFQAKLSSRSSIGKWRNNTEAYRLFLSFFITTLIFGFCFGKTKNIFFLLHQTTKKSFTLDTDTTKTFHLYKLWMCTVLVLNACMDVCRNIHCYFFLFLRLVEYLVLAGTRGVLSCQTLFKFQFPLAKMLILNFCLAYFFMVLKNHFLM